MYGVCKYVARSSRLCACLFLSCAGNATKIFAAFHQNFFILEDVNKGLSECVVAGWKSPLVGGA